MAELLTYLTRLYETPRYYGRGLYRQLDKKNIFLWSQAIAFKVLITIVPVIILATGILGQVLQREKPFDTVATFVRNFLPPAESDQLVAFLRRLSSAGDVFTIVGMLALLFSALTLFTTLRVVVGNIFQEDWHEDRSILGGYLFDLRMVGQVGLLFFLTLGLTVTVQTLNEALFETIGWVSLLYVRDWIVNIVVLLVPFLITTVMFFQLFYFVPKPHPPRQSALFGALFSAVLWEAAKSGFTLYAQYVGRFERYSGEGAQDVLGGTFGLIIAFVFWVYYSGLVLCLGAIMGLLHEKRHRSRRLAARTEAASASKEEVVAEEATAETPAAPTPRGAPDPPPPIETSPPDGQRLPQPAPSSKASEDLSVN